MIRLSELSPEERACLRLEKPEDHLQAFAERLRQKLIAALGQKVTIGYFPGDTAHARPEGNEPVIEIEDGLAEAWLTVRYGGRAEVAAWQFSDSSLLTPLSRLVRRTLAESVFNAGDNASWPEAMSFQASIGKQQGELKIVWNSMHAMSWARRAIREKK